MHLFRAIVSLGKEYSGILLAATNVRMQIGLQEIVNTHWAAQLKEKLEIE